MEQNEIRISAISPDRYVVPDYVVILKQALESLSKSFLTRSHTAEGFSVE